MCLRKIDSWNGSEAMTETLREMIEKFATFGKTENGGISRTFGSDAYLQASLALKEYLCSAGIQSYIDSVGNVHGLYGGAQKELIIASHLDTVAEGGKFDGLLGVVAGVRCILRLMEEKSNLTYRVHLIATNGEEGNVLGGTFGSRCLMGTYSDYKLLKENFPIVVNAETGAPLTKQDIINSRLREENINSYIELHVEQGNRLENQHKKIGIVTGIVGLQRYKITVRGSSNHSGTTMMEYRDDALVKAAKITVYCDNLAKNFGNDFVATVSGVSVFPNVLAVINETVEMTLECRNLDENLLDRYTEAVKNYCNTIEGVTIVRSVKKEAVGCEESIMACIETICREKELTYIKMPSGATHDASIFGQKIPVGMIFIPSCKGISHNKDEFSRWEDCELGSEVLYSYVRAKVYAT